VGGLPAGAVLFSDSTRSKRSSLVSRSAGSVYDFDSVAESYDNWYFQPVGQMYDRLEKEAIARLLPSPATGDRLLEVGCGTGHWSAFFAERGFRVTGLDISGRMLEMARKKRIPRAAFYQSDAGAIPFADDTFDLAAAITVLEFSPQPRRVVEEMVRCARPGGRLIVGALNRWSYLGLSRKMVLKPVFQDARFFSLGELRELLSSYGEVNVRSTACFLPWRQALPIAPVLDRAASGVRLPFGDFLVGEVRL